MTRPFWQRKTLAQMSPDEWEALCDGCAKCCLIRLEDEDTGRTAETNIACKLLDLKTCRCGDYQNSARLVPDCLVLKPEIIDDLHWMPSTCAYRLLAEGKDLPHWHPLVSGRADSVHEAGHSVRAWAISETEIDEDEIADHIQAIEFGDDDPQ